MNILPTVVRYLEGSRSDPDLDTKTTAIILLCELMYSVHPEAFAAWFPTLISPLLSALKIADHLSRDLSAVALMALFLVGMELISDSFLRLLYPSIKSAVQALRPTILVLAAGRNISDELRSNLHSAGHLRRVLAVAREEEEGSTLDLKSIGFCASLPSGSHSTDISAASAHEQGLFCSIPFLASLPFCTPESTPDNDGDGDPTFTLDQQWMAYSAFIDSSLLTPGFGREMRAFILSLEDLNVLVLGSTLDNKVALHSQFAHIQYAARDAQRRLQLYSSRLVASIKVILTSAENTVTTAQTVSRSTTKRIDATKLDMAYRHTLTTFEILNRELAHLNGETYEAITTLESHINVLYELVYSEAFHEVQADVQEILSWLMTKFWGNRELLSHAHERLDVLRRVVASAKLMKGLVLDVQFRLEVLQIETDALCRQAEEPLLIGGPTPVEEVVRALREGCLTLKEQLGVARGQVVGSLGT
ncbi:hypothetical protein NLJ89_g8250 [Agrocybe chaxingu]|uniref:Uncharacterized protein n=1 Tax=Agrocybe chaxingu TaxID=84603 RepID=A0A9W8JV20_9AGAR|nr:hypothetical protein NLJ89_g8250 [Agrocybe chaxingu]